MYGFRRGSGGAGGSGNVSTLSGGANGRITLWNGATTVTGDPSGTWSGTGHTFVLGSPTFNASDGHFTGPAGASFGPSSVGGGFTNQPAGDTIDLVSDDAGDTTQQVTIIGTLAGVDASENIMLNGIVPVTSAGTYDLILALVLNGACAGTVTASETSGGLAITTIAPAALSAGLQTFAAIDGYGKVLQIVASGATTKTVGIGGYALGGGIQREPVVLTGTTKVNTTLTWEGAVQFYLGDLEATRTVTLNSIAGFDFRSVGGVFEPVEAGSLAASNLTPGQVLLASAATGSTGATSITGDPGLTYDAVTKTLTTALIGGSGVARYHSPISRNYDAYAIVSTTITAALAAIVDASALKRYLLYVPDGTYAEEIQLKDYVDIVGQSRSGVIITSASAASDTINGGGIQTMLSNLTVNHTANAKYPIHLDDATAAGITGNNSSTTIISNVSATASGASAKSGIGIGLRGYQRVYLIDSSFTATAGQEGVFAHNVVAPQIGPASLNVINCTISSSASSGLAWTNFGSGKTDLVRISGGSISGTTDIVEANSGAGAGEARILISDGTVYSTTTLADAATIVAFEGSVPVPLPSQPGYQEYTGTVTTGASGVAIGSDGQVVGKIGFNVAPSLTYQMDVAGIMHMSPAGGSASTAATYFAAQNAGNLAYFGAESVAGGGIFVGSTGYATVLGTSQYLPVEFAVNSTVSFRLPPAGGAQLITGTLPAANAGNRGLVFYVAGGVGVADTIQICAKSTLDAYAWYPMATIP